ncbi:MAG: hypothetical protein KDA75_09850 [Planctomycetaceae bacterium]|nr:hypothetical protein [Planctomycetaceae bacterium]
MRTSIAAAGWFSLLVFHALLPAGEPRSRILLNPQFDPDAARIALFEGIESGALDAKMMPRDEQGGAVFVQNLTDQALTVEMPDAFVGVQVLPQLNLQLPLNGSDLFSGNQQQNQQAGQNQPVGGGTSRNQNNSSANDPFPTFFSVPPERTARIEYASVCLEHGAVSPRRGNVYRLVRVEEFTTDPRLAALLTKVARREGKASALQAAAWHLANDMNWDDLQALQFRHVNAPDSPWFAESTLRSARSIVKLIDADLAGAQTPTDKDSIPALAAEPSVKLRRSGP